MSVHSLACNQRRCWLMRMNSKLFPSIPFFTRIYAPGTWKKHPKLSGNMKDFPKMFRPVYDTIPAWSEKLTKNLHFQKLLHTHTHVSFSRGPRFIWHLSLSGVGTWYKDGEFNTSWIDSGLKVGLSPIVTTVECSSRMTTNAEEISFLLDLRLIA